MTKDIENLPIRTVCLTDTRFKADMKFLLNNIVVADLKKIAQPLINSLSSFQYKSVGKPNAAEPKAINNVRNGVKLKADLLDFLLVFFCPSNWGYFLQGLSQPMQNLFMALAEKHYIVAEEAEKIYGKKVFLDRGYWCSRLVDDLQIFVNNSAERFYDNNGWPHIQPFLFFKNTSLYSLMLTWQCEHQNQNEVALSLDGLQTFNAENDIFHDLPFVATLYESGRLKVGGTKLRTKSFEKAVEKFEVKDFNIGSQSEWTSYCSRRYFVPMLYAVYAEEGGLEALVAKEDIIRAVVIGNDEYAGCFYKLFLPHIKGFKQNCIDYRSVLNFIKNIFDIFSENKIADWTSVEHLCSMLRTFDSGEKNDFAESDYLLFDSYDLTRQKLGNQYTDRVLNLNNQIHELSDVVVKSVLFALASWGVLEVAYLPEMPKDAVSPFDALRYVRLTKLGRYVYDLDKDYTPPISKDETNALELIEDRLLIKVNKTDSPRVFILERFAQPVAPTLYKVDAKFFMKDCTNKSDVEAKIALFKRTFGKSLPPLWSNFLEDMLTRCDAFSTAGKAYVIRRVNKNDKRLQEIILTDSRLKSYIRRAEGYLIMIEQKHLNEVISIMREYGYLM